MISTSFTGISCSTGKVISLDIENGIIARIRNLPQTNENGLPYLSPGFVDLQVNGFRGVDFSSPGLTTKEMQKVNRALQEEGVTTYLPTLITDSRENLIASFRSLADARLDEAISLSVPGFHLEGPYISPLPGYRGAHPEKHVRLPDWDEFSVFQRTADNGIRMITLAPESVGAISFIRKCTAGGITVALGHHNAGSEIIKLATDAGASLCTHLGNGLANLIDRHRNPLWPQLAEDRLSATLIADGAHLTPDELLCFFRMKGTEHLILVSDLLDLAGLTPGSYTRRASTIELTPEVAKYPAENVLAGAVQPLHTDISNFMRITGCSLSQTIHMATAGPARAIGLSDRGTLEVGKRADLVLFHLEDGRINIQQTVLAGKTVYHKENAE